MEGWLEHLKKTYVVGTQKTYLKLFVYLKHNLYLFLILKCSI